MISGLNSLGRVEVNCILTSKIYKGQHYKGATDNNPNLIALEILNAKHKGNKAAFVELSKIAIDALKGKGFDVLIPIRSQNSMY